MQALRLLRRAARFLQSAGQRAFDLSADAEAREVAAVACSVDVVGGHVNFAEQLAALVAVFLEDHGEREVFAGALDLTSCQSEGFVRGDVQAVERLAEQGRIKILRLLAVLERNGDQRVAVERAADV